MVEKINILKGLSKDVIETTLEIDLKALGQKKFDIRITPQAKIIIGNYGEKFPWEHFKVWFLKKKQAVNGSHIHEYLQDKAGFEEGIKG